VSDLEPSVTSSIPSSCVACHGSPALAGLLCDTCRARLTCPTGLIPQQVYSSCDPEGDVALVDQWGRELAVGTSTVIGRSTSHGGITILDASVSRLHARLVREHGAWRLRDLGSSNGTSVNGSSITECAVRAGDWIRIASIGFAFVARTASGAGARLQDIATRVRPADEAAASPPKSLAVVILGTGGAGGIIEIEHVRTRLSRPQLALVEVLATRMVADRHQPEPVRGFVRSAELRAKLTSDGGELLDGGIKQLVRRVRRRLLALGCGDLIEARRGQGYRLRVAPEALARLQATEPTAEP
jgi:pSer/pThr/pTyr-binding forkhead associated (FHA) protein